jgi:hypothetical protein
MELVLRKNPLLLKSNPFSPDSQLLPSLKTSKNFN